MSFNRDIPFIGFHTRISTHEGAKAIVKLVEELFAPNGLNTLILEVNGYQYECFPEFHNGEMDKNDAKMIKEVCDKHGIRIVPLFQCLSHQDGKWSLYKAHPEFLETPHIPDDAYWPDIYCHHWCASNDDIYKFVFPMIDELVEVFGSEAVHIGLDEVFDIGEDCCPRCAGKDKAELYLRTVNILHDYLTSKGLDTMIWGDRLLDCKKLGMQMWEADRFGMYRAFEKMPKAIMICAWHYDLHAHGYYSTEQFISNGFFDIPSFGHEVEQAKHFWGFCLEDLYLSRKYKWPGKLGGVLFTHWSFLTLQGAQDMIDCAKGEFKGERKQWGSASVGETIQTMAKSCAQFRKVY